MTDTLSIYNNIVLLSVLSCVDYLINQTLLIVIIFFRKKNLLSTVCKTAP